MQTLAGVADPVNEIGLHEAVDIFILRSDLHPAALDIGKNSLQNERLTQSARGDEIWLHAKDMPGSHVIIHNEGKPVADATLLTAANLAAWFSKGKGLSVPVDMTLKKYVKKPAGTPTGFVTYTHQKTYRITVSEADIRAIKQLKNK